MVNLFPFSPAPDKSTLVCDECGQAISDTHAACVLRNDDALPEDFSAFHTHARCAVRFMAHHPGRWHAYNLQAPEARWLLPLLPQRSRPAVAPRRRQRLSHEPA